MNTLCLTYPLFILASTIYELFDLAYKMYGITLDYKVVILNGNITNLELRIVSSVENVILKADDIYLDELNINNSNKEGINKVIYHPKEGNIFFKDIKEYEVKVKIKY